MYQVPQYVIPGGNLKDCEHGWYFLVGTPFVLPLHFYRNNEDVFLIIIIWFVHRMEHLLLTQPSRGKI